MSPPIALYGHDINIVRYPTPTFCASVKQIGSECEWFCEKTNSHHLLAAIKSARTPGLDVVADEVFVGLAFDD